MKLRTSFVNYFSQLYIYFNVLTNLAFKYFTRLNFLLLIFYISLYFNNVNYTPFKMRFGVNSCLNVIIDAQINVWKALYSIDALKWVLAFLTNLLLKIPSRNYLIEISRV